MWMASFMESSTNSLFFPRWCSDHIYRKKIHLVLIQLHVQFPWFSTNVVEPTVIAWDLYCLASPLLLTTVWKLRTTVGLWWLNELWPTEDSASVYGSCSFMSSSLHDRALTRICVHRQWFLEAFLIPCIGFHDRIRPVFNAVLPDGLKILGVQYSALFLVHRDFSSSHESCDDMYGRWGVIQSLQLYVEEHYSEIVPQFAHTVLQICEPLIVSEKLCLSKVLFLYQIMLNIWYQLTYFLFFFFPIPTFLRHVATIKFKIAKLFLKIVHFLNLNICYVFWVLL